MNFNTGALTFTKVLGGISKSLGVINQIIPIYKETKPLYQNAKKVFNLFKGTAANHPEKNSSKNEKKTISKGSNSPQFFI